MILDTTQKQTVDFYVALVVIVSWLRYFVYFLLIRPVSKLLMTLIEMLKDTISFMFIMCCYLLLAATIFTTLFQGPAPEKYGSMSLCFRTIFDYTLGEYENDEIAYNNDSHSYLMMIHIVISNIFLLNYLIAILSTVYVTMKFLGDFLYKANLYSYIEKYQLARLDDRGLTEYVINPAPLNLLTLFLIPFTVQPRGPMYGQYFSKFMYWIENLLMMVFFGVYLCLLLPIIYVKMLYHLFKNTKLLNFIWAGALWIVFGAILLPCYVIKDLVYFIKINCDDGDKEMDNTDVISEEYKQEKLELYNQVYKVMKSTYV